MIQSLLQDDQIKDNKQLEFSISSITACKFHEDQLSIHYIKDGSREKILIFEINSDQFKLQKGKIIDDEKRFEKGNKKL